MIASWKNYLFELFSNNSFDKKNSDNLTPNIARKTIKIGVIIFPINEDGKSANSERASPKQAFIATIYLFRLFIKISFHVDNVKIKTIKQIFLLYISFYLLKFF